MNRRVLKSRHKLVCSLHDPNPQLGFTLPGLQTLSGQTLGQLKISSSLL